MYVYGCTSLIKYYEEPKQRETKSENNLKEKKKEFEIDYDKFPNDESNEKYKQFYNLENSIANEISLNFRMSFYLNRAQIAHYYINSNNTDEQSLSFDTTEIPKRDNNINKSETILNIYHDLFFSLNGRTKKENINLINTSNMFCGCSSLKSLSDISNWNIIILKKCLECLGIVHHYYLYLIYLDGILIMFEAYPIYFVVAYY